MTDNDILTKAIDLIREATILLDQHASDDLFKRTMRTGDKLFEALRELKMARSELNGGQY